jgi:hypothetical protein
MSVYCFASNNEMHTILAYLCPKTHGECKATKKLKSHFFSNSEI